jgi:hypothetical protein
MPKLRSSKPYRTGNLSVTIAERESSISQADKFDRRQGIISIMACFLDEFAHCIDLAEEMLHHARVN